MRTAVMQVVAETELNRRLLVYDGIPRFPSRLEAAVSTINLHGFTIDKRKRFWHVIDPRGQLVCITVYKRGAKEVVHRLTR